MLEITDIRIIQVSGIQVTFAKLGAVLKVSVRLANFGIKKLDI